MPNYLKQDEKYKKTAIRETLEITLTYFVFAYAYLWVSDWLIKEFISNPELSGIIQTIKGFISLGLIGIVYHFIVYRRIHRFLSNNDELKKLIKEFESQNKLLTELEEKHFQIAYFDSLTGLINKNRLKVRIDRLVEKKVRFAMLYIDIDDFGAINELKGHVWGDQALVLIARELEKIAKDHMVARMSEDSFVLVFLNYESTEHVNELAQKSINAIKNLMAEQSEAYFYSASAGVALYPEHGSDYDEVLRYSNLALSAAKKNGKDQYVFYNKFMHEAKQREYELTNQIIPSLENNEFYIEYQPILSFKTNEINKIEALMRWMHPTMGYIPPNEFIALSEISGSIMQLTHFLYDTVFNQLSIWKKLGKKIRTDINISPKVLMHPNFIEDLLFYVDKHKIDSDQVIVEITESMALDNITDTVLVIKELKQKGFLVALDDFGSGYSSLTYFKHLPVDIVKMDKDFIATIDKSENERYFLKFVLDLSHSMKKEVVLEGVERIEQIEILKQYNIDYVQGFYYYRPSSVEYLNKLFGLTNEA
ncbi:putative bifunctional diguanylate cyclase/phosphodiesterase [Acholeplasma granularum]|uniref:putative bifunctional diguanylate cyclase/phosphodiesterase n=1 Tax=Acholeplasma granularum TaxID=264635 RepID=UPI000471D1CC|nr:bifunctional diguanylate cyclase/phosphodiesterase [Acholeplasma granularum]